MPIIEVEALAKTFKTRERAAGLAGSLHSFIAPRYRQREAKYINRSRVQMFICKKGWY